MRYIILNNNTFDYQKYSITPIRFEDLESIMNWRNSQIDVLRQKKKLTIDDQYNYFNKSIKPNFSLSEPNQILFSFLKDKICIGYGGLTNLDWISKRTELSFLLNSERILNPIQYEKDFTSFLKLIKIVIFEELKFNRVFTETYDIRPHHISILEKNGFIFEGRLKQHNYINEKYVDSLIHGFLSETFKT